MLALLSAALAVAIIVAITLFMKNKELEKNTSYLMDKAIDTQQRNIEIRKNLYEMVEALEVAVKSEIERADKAEDNLSQYTTVNKNLLDQLESQEKVIEDLKLKAVKMQEYSRERILRMYDLQIEVDQLKSDLDVATKPEE